MATPENSRRYCPRHSTLPERLAMYTSQPNSSGCTEWTGSRIRTGYGNLKWKGRVQRAHRLAWESVNGAIPSGKHVLHRCDNPACVNVDHLWLGTHIENTADKVAKGRQSHLKGEENPAASIAESTALAIKAAIGRHVDVARRMGVSTQIVRDIRAGRTWTHV